MGGNLLQFRNRHGDLVAAAVTLAFAGFIFLETLEMSARITAYPRVLASLLAVAGVVLLLQAIRRRTAGEPLFADIVWRPLIASVAVWGSAIYLGTLFGFYPVIAVMIAALLWILEGYPRAPSSLARIVGFGVATATLLWLIFRQWLDVVTPEGTLF